MSIGQQQELYKGFNFSDLVQQIHSNTNDNNKVIGRIVSQILQVLKNSSESQQSNPSQMSMIMIPALKSIMDTKIKNDQQLIKLAGVIQKIIAPSGKNTGQVSTNLFSQQQIKQLRQIDDKTNDLKTKIQQIPQSISQIENLSQSILKDYNFEQDQLQS